MTERELAEQIYIAAISRKIAECDDSGLMAYPFYKKQLRNCADDAFAAADCFLRQAEELEYGTELDPDGTGDGKGDTD